MCCVVVVDVVDVVGAGVGAGSGGVAAVIVDVVVDDVAVVLFFAGVVVEAINDAMGERRCTLQLCMI